MALNELRALRTFLLAAEKRNFAQVAREMDMTAASVTRTIAALEEELGVQLFVRTTRQVALTTEGGVFAARIAPVILALDHARQELVEAHKANEGRLRINAPMSFGQRVLPQVLCGFRSLFPKIDVEVSLTDELIEMVDEGFDLAIRISGPPSNKFTIWRKICEIPRILVTAPDSVAASATHPNDLSGGACLAYSADSRREIWELTHAGATVTLSAGRQVSSNNGEVLAKMAADGAGVALLPVFIVAEQLRNGSLVEILPEWVAPKLWLTLYYPPYHALPPRIAAFSKFFEEEIPPLVRAIHR